MCDAGRNKTGISNLRKKIFYVVLTFRMALKGSTPASWKRQRQRPLYVTEADVLNIDGRCIFYHLARACLQGVALVFFHLLICKSAIISVQKIKCE